MLSSYNVHDHTHVHSCSAAIYANRHYLRLYRQRNPQRLARGKPRSRNPSLNVTASSLPTLALEGVPVVEGPVILEDVYIHPSAHVDPTAIVRLASGALVAFEGLTRTNTS